MKQRDIRLIRMIEELIHELDNHEKVWNNYGVIINRIHKIKRIIALVQRNISKQINSGIEAYSRQKNLILSELVLKVHKIALKVKGYAKINQNNSILQVVDISIEKIMEEKDEDILQICENILNQAASIQEHLIEDFNLSEELIIGASANLMQVKQMINIKDSLNTTDTLLSENMKEIMTELKVAIDVLDDLIYGIIEDHKIISIYRKIRKKAEVF
jgi:hypothetical protein